MNGIQASAAGMRMCGGGGGGGFRRGCGDLSASSEDQSVASGALDEFRIHCPNCSHQFALSEGLLMEEGDEEEAAAAAAGRLMAGGEASSAGADTAHDSVESLAMDRDGAHHVGNGTLLKVAAARAGGGVSRIPVAAAGSVNAGFAASVNYDADSDGAAAAEEEEDDEEAAAAAVAAAANGEDARSSQPVSRCYQIINWTVEELEKVICDPNDRRIRKISSISQCDIEVRSEMAPTKFGAPKNFCILRASQLVSIDQCRGLLKRQLLWVMRPKAQDAEPAPPSSPGR